jgi:L-lactate dehydrogenase
MKLSILGAGRVGTAIAFAAVLRGTPSELVLVGRDRRKAEGEAMDLEHAAAFVRPMVVRAASIEETAGSDVIVMSAAIPLEGPKRDSVTEANAAVVRDLATRLGELSPSGVIIVVSNPVDALTLVALRASGLPAAQVLGTGTLLDTGRLRAHLSEASGVHSNDIRAYVLGEHGDSQFAALGVASYGGVRFDANDPVVRRSIDRARSGGYDVAGRKGSTWYGIAAATAMIIHAIDEDTREVLPVSTYLDNYQGVSGVCLGVPCVIGRGGVRRVLPIELDDTERRQLHASAEIVREQSRRAGV